MFGEQVDSVGVAHRRGPTRGGVLDLSRAASLTAAGTVRNPFFGRVPLRVRAPVTRGRNRVARKKRQTTSASRTYLQTNAREERREVEVEEEEEEGTEPVFERSGESGGYTFTDLHYPRSAPLCLFSLSRLFPSPLPVPSSTRS